MSTEPLDVCPNQDDGCPTAPTAPYISQPPLDVCPNEIDGCVTNTVPVTTAVVTVAPIRAALPATGSSDIALGGAASILIVVGILLCRVARRPVASR